MTDRRGFLKSLAFGCLAPIGLAADAAGADAGRGPEVQVVVPISDVPWRRRLFCQFDRARYPELDRALHQVAAETGCDIVFGEKGYPDIYAVGGFALVVDRGEVGEKAWGEYVDMYRDDRDATPCFVIDDREDLPMPDWSFGYRFDMADPRSVPTIAEAVRQMKEEMNRRLPELFRRRNGERTVATSPRSSQ